MAATVSDLTNIVYSGDPRVDALLDSPAVWNFWPTARNVLYYTFDVGTGSVMDQKLTQSVTRFNASQQQATRQILQTAALATGIVFTEVSGSAAADVHFGASNLAGAATAGLCSSFYSYSYRSDGVLTQLEAESLVLLDNVEHAGINNAPTAGSVGYEVLLHEVGHMLGLAHPFETDRPLPQAQDHSDNTVMSYTWRGSNKTTFQSYDLLALDWIYGRDGLGGSWGFNSTNGPSLALNTQPVQVTGTALADLFASTAANESFDGAGGLDRINFQGLRADHAVVRQSDAWRVTDAVAGRDGIDTARQVERLHFSDMALALDLSGAAGAAARLMGAVVGAPGLANRAWVGVVLGLVDAGVPAPQLADLALKAVLGPTVSNAQVVAHVYANLFHAAPEVSMARGLTQLLDAGAYSRADLVQYAAALDVNAANIDLVGLSARGLEFQPLA